MDHDRAMRVQKYFLKHDSNLYSAGNAPDYLKASQLLLVAIACVPACPGLPPVDHHDELTHTFTVHRLEVLIGGLPHH